MGVVAIMETVAGRIARPQVVEQREGQAVGYVRRQIEAIADDFFLTVFLGVMHCDVAREGIDGKVGVGSKRRVFLDQVVSK